KATIQARDHKEIEFTGKRDGAHPLLTPVTDNNMVAGDETSPVRYQIPPMLIDLTHYPREHVMDENPITYQVMAKELVRENKLRPGTKADPIAEIGFQCVVPPPAHSGACRLEQVGKAFFLDDGRPIFTRPDAVDIPTGEIATFPR